MLRSESHDCRRQPRLGVHLGLWCARPCGPVTCNRHGTHSCHSPLPWPLPPCKAEHVWHSSGACALGDYMRLGHGVQQDELLPKVLKPFDGVREQMVHPQVRRSPARTRATAHKRPCANRHHHKPLPKTPFILPVTAHIPTLCHPRPRSRRFCAQVAPIRRASRVRVGASCFCGTASHRQRAWRLARHCRMG